MTVHLDSLYGGYWGEHPDYPQKEWADEVADDATRLGYWDWVEQQIDIAEEDDDD